MIKKIWDHLEEWILVPMIAFSAVLLFVQVVMRYVFRNSLSWSEELARFLYIWEVWLGIAYATKTGEHLRVTLVYNLVKGRAAFILRVAVNILWLAFGILMACIGGQTMISIMNFGQLSSAMRIPMWLVYLAVPTGAFLMAVRLIEDTVRLCKAEYRRGREETAL